LSIFAKVNHPSCLVWFDLCFREDCLINFFKIGPTCIICKITNFIEKSEIYVFCNTTLLFQKGPSWSWSYGNWIYNYLCNQCLSPLTLRVQTPVHGEVYSIQHYVIKFVSDLRQVGGFLWALQFPPLIKLTATI
jgi:hypothetical protein